MIRQDSLVNTARLLALALVIPAGKAACDTAAAPLLRAAPPSSAPEAQFIRPVQYSPIVLGRTIITVPSDWQHEVSEGPDGVLLADISRPGSSGYMKIMLRTTPRPVSPRRLRMITNVDSSIHLPWQSWGDFAGYQYDHVHAGSHYRQWWLVNGDKLLFFVYSSDTNSTAERERVNRIMHSISIGGRL